MTVDYSACTWSVWEDAWCHTGGIKGTLLCRRENKWSWPCLPCRRRPHTPPLYKATRTETQEDPGLAMDRICAGQPLLKCNCIDFMMMRELRADITLLAAETCNFWTWADRVLSFCHVTLFADNYLPIVPLGRSQRDWHLNGFYFLTVFVGTNCWLGLGQTGISVLSLTFYFFTNCLNMSLGLQG